MEGMVCLLDGGPTWDSERLPLPPSRPLPPELGPALKLGPGQGPWAPLSLGGGGWATGRALLLPFLLRRLAEKRRRQRWSEEGKKEGRKEGAPEQEREEEESHPPAPCSLRRWTGAAMALLSRGPPGFLLLVTQLAAAVEIYTPRTLEALNGTDVRLKCSFQSRAPITQRLTISWHFQSLAKGPTEFVFYYHEQAYLPETGHFLGRVTWDGNALNGDASIMIWNVSPRDNGTFHCLVKNPPDVDGVAGEIQLSIVLKVSFSEIHILALTVGGACALMIAIVVVVVVCRQRQKARQGPKVETELPEKEKLRRNPAEAQEVTLPGEEA